MNNNIASLSTLMPMRLIMNSGEVRVIFMDFLNTKAYQIDGSEVQDFDLVPAMTKYIEQHAYATVPTGMDDIVQTATQAMQQQEKIVRRSEVAKARKDHVEQPEEESDGSI